MSILSRLVLLGALVAFALQAGYGMLEAVAAERWTRLARNIEGSQTPLSLPPAYVAQLATRLQSSATSRCAYGRSAAATTVAAYLLRDKIGRSAPETELAGSLSDAIRVARFAISCTPLDAYQWQALAILERMQGASLVRQRQLVDISRRMAPASGALLYNRALFESASLLPATGEGSREIMQDLQDAATLLKPADARAVIAAIEAAGRTDLAERILAELPAERRQVLKGAPDDEPIGAQKLLRYRDFTIDPFARVVRTPVAKTEQ